VCRQLHSLALGCNVVHAGVITAAAAFAVNFGKPGVRLLSALVLKMVIEFTHAQTVLELPFCRL
jgi:hypothetical protein